MANGSRIPGHISLEMVTNSGCNDVVGVDHPVEKTQTVLGISGCFDRQKGGTNAGRKDARFPCGRKRPRDT